MNEAYGRRIVACSTECRGDVASSGVVFDVLTIAPRALGLTSDMVAALSRQYLHDTPQFPQFQRYCNICRRTRE
jgi:hypothetical protein